MRWNGIRWNKIAKASHAMDWPENLTDLIKEQVGAPIGVASNPTIPGNRYNLAGKANNGIEPISRQRTKSQLKILF